ncbi:MAG: hypothetical protein CM15mP74_28130 [Halieaceae bacterium]|nr:MAG: hypothetical protein CM15mP74_28130 [Halieaceae bacterium]
MPDEIYECARQILPYRYRAVIDWGDHFVSYPLLKHTLKNMASCRLSFLMPTQIPGQKKASGLIMAPCLSRRTAGAYFAGTLWQIGLRTHNDSDHGLNIFDAPAVHDMKPADLAAR